MSPYLAAFAAAAALDSLPAFVPPSWVALVFLQVHYRLDARLLTLIGVAGSATGRLVLTTYVRRAAAHILSRHEEHNIEYLGKSLKGRFWEDFAFIFLYCLTPLSTSPLFLGASLAGVSRLIVFPPFVAGKLINYGVMLAASRQAAPDIEAMLHGRFSFAGVSMACASLSLVAAMLFIDWHALLRDKRLRLDFRVPTRKRRKLL